MILEMNPKCEMVHETDFSWMSASMSLWHSTLDPVMVSVVGSIPTGGNFLLKLFQTLDVNSGLKCKYDLIMKNFRLILIIDFHTSLVS